MYKKKNTLLYPEAVISLLKLLKRKEGHCLILSPVLGLLLSVLVRLPWSLLAGAAALRLPADSAELSLPENPGSRLGLQIVQSLLPDHDCPLVGYVVL